MITRRTKIQLVIFVVITLLGVSFVGAKYAQLDRLILDDSYRVTAHFADSGGAFVGSAVTYRGVRIGKVGDMELTDEGVDIMLDIDNGNDTIPAETRALVGNKSAVGEQFVELQPTADDAPYLRDGSQIEQSDTAIPIQSATWVADTQRLVESIPADSLNIVVDEFGEAFGGTGDDLAALIDSSTSFIETANDNFEITRELIDDSNVVLGTQLDKASAIQSFARDLAAVSQTLVDSDADLRRVITNGSATADQLRGFLEDNKVDLAALLDNLATTGEIAVKHLAGTEMVLILYPYVVSGAYVVVDKTPGTGLYDAHFGLILTQEPAVCHQGYDSTDKRPPQNRGNRPMNEDARCTEPPGASNARGAQNAPSNRVAPEIAARPATGSEPTVAAYDRRSGELTFGDAVAGSADVTREGAVTYTGGAAAAFGRESWKWLLLQPLMQQ